MSQPSTPITFSKELKQVLNERNLLTAKTRKKVCSMLDNLNSSNLCNNSPHNHNDLDKRHKFRLQAIEEILTSEKTYLKQLEILMHYFIIPLKEKSIINASIHMQLFGQIEMIYNLNGELFKELENNLENVGNAFLKIAPFLKLYSVYAFDYKNSLLILQDLLEKNSVFRKFLDDNETRPEVQMKLNSLMIVPIQRLPRYRLLLDQVLLYTSPADADYKILKESVKQIELIVSHINSVVEDQEITQILLNLQNSLLNRSPNIVKPSRKIIKEGILHKLTRNGTQVKRYCALMSDIFMYCKILKDRTQDTVVENSLQCCCIFPLKKCKIYESFPGSFKITCQGDGIILCTEDFVLSRSWVKILKDTIDIHIECRKTLRKESSKRMPLRKKEVNNFEANDIISQSKKKYEYESVYRCKSISDDEDEKEMSRFSLPCFSMKSFAKKRKYNENGSLSSDFIYKAPSSPPTQALKNNKNNQKRMKLSCLSKKSLSAAPCEFMGSKPSSTLNDNIESNSLLNYSGSVQNAEKLKSETNFVTSCDEFDPTYGFANRISDSKTYFRAHNVDSTIPKAFPNNPDFIEELKQEVLYTPRNNNLSISTKPNLIEKTGKENINPTATISPSFLYKKRVRFNHNNLIQNISISEGQQKKPGDKFSSENQNSEGQCGVSLLQRISNYFVNLLQD